MQIRKTIILLVMTTFSLSVHAENKIDYDTMYSACIKKMGGINNGTVEACSNKTSDAAKKELNSLYPRVYQRILTESDEDAAKFEQSQKSWLNYRNLNCSLKGSYVGSPMFGYCPMALNIERVKELRELSQD